MFRLRRYQERHVSDLKKKIDEFLNLESSKICVFKSPTGSGKTIMMAELIKRLADDRKDGKEIAFVWITVHKLHDQSKEKLERYYEDLQTVECAYFEDLQDRQIRDKEILFFNWQSINQEKNIYIRENEKEFNLDRVIENTGDEGREIVLIIDESHHTASSEKSREVIQKINPKITIEVSATPKISNADYVESVDLQEVKEEEMIKKSVRLNHKLRSITDSTTDELIIRTALEKRRQLKKNYEHENSDVNPLVLIQLPDSHKGVQDRKDQIIKILNSRFGINTDNGKLAIYLSDKDNKVNLENIEKNTNEVEVLIFKQAITVGWDCPRSSILVLFREWKKFEFSIQTIGRIIRMPEVRHYDNDELNHAFVYTNISDIRIAEDVTRDYITVYESVRRASLYDVLDLKSIYIRRKHEKSRLTGQFYDIFLKTAKNYNLSDKIEREPQEPKSKLLVDGKIEQLDQEQTIEGNEVLVASTSLEIQRQFDAFLRDCSEGFAPVHSSERIKRSLYTFFEQNVKITDWNEIQKIILDPANQGHFVYAVNRAKERFRAEIVDSLEKDIEYIQKWNIPESTEYTKVYDERNYKKCIMSPAYIKTGIQNEIRFMEFLEKENSVKWWFKNEVNDKKYFAIKYMDPDAGYYRAFYVDFVIRMSDGRIGLFDPKDGVTAKIAKPKAEALAKYIKDNKSKKVFGGIAVFKNGEWLYNDNKKYEYNEKDFSDWKSLDLN